MRSPLALLLALTGTLLFVSAGFRSKADEPTVGAGSQAARPVDFSREIAPLLEERCLRCHSPNNRKGDVSLATAADLNVSGYIVPGKPEASYLMDLITPEGQERPAMPKEGTPLTPEQVALVRRWISQGADWPQDVVLRERSKADTSWWSLQPLAEVTVPAGEGFPAGWRDHPIDRFIAAELHTHGLVPNGPAQRRDLIRRATYDLTGLPPTPEEVAEFVADRSPDAYERLIDRLLESPRYGEHWGRHWLDVIRFGESRGFERNQIIDNLWPLRDYVIRSFNSDRPFDQVIREHLAGDVFGKDQPDVEVASAFLVAGPYDDVGNQDPAQAAQIRANTLDEIISSSGEAFLGLTVGCARCHDHKFDPILQQDYYGLYATFAGVRHGEREVATLQQRQARETQLAPLRERREQLTRNQDALQAAVRARAEEHRAGHEARWIRPPISRQGTEETFPPVEARLVRLVVDGQEDNPTARTGYKIDEFEVWTAGEGSENVALAARGGTAQGASKVAEDFMDAYSAQLTIDGRFGARWIAAGPELTITLSRPFVVNRVYFSSDRTGAAGKHNVASFVSEYRILVSTDGTAWTEVANSRDRQPVNEAHRKHRLYEAELTQEERNTLSNLQQQLAAVDRELAAVKPLPVWWLGTRESAPGPFPVFLGGSPQRPGPMASPSSLSALAGVVPPYQLDSAVDEGQRRLALADWIVHPQNPLTPRVLANRIWHYHFGTGIVDTPSDFGYMGGRPTHPALLDWLAGELLRNGWQLKPLHKRIMLSQAYQQSSDYRADAAAIDADSRLLWRFPPRRLSAEEVRDTLLLVTGRLDLRMGGPGYRLYQYLQDNVATYVPLDRPGPDTYRRAVYHQNARAARVDLMTDFDSPDCAFSTPRRSETTTPLQALTMLNHQFTLDMAGALAQRLQRETDAQPASLVRRAFELCYSRLPAEEELQECSNFLGEYGLAALCRVLLNTSEVIYVQ